MPQTRAYITNLKMNPETGVLYPACPRPAENAAQAGRTCQKKLRFDQNSNAWFAQPRDMALHTLAAHPRPCCCFRAGTATSTTHPWRPLTIAT